jgi:Zn ribbon nucleic-acid-binding protein
MDTPTSRADRLRRVRAHRCPTCRTPWSLRVVDHPAGRMVVCVACGSARSGAQAELHAVGSGRRDHVPPTDLGEYRQRSQRRTR